MRDDQAWRFQALVQAQQQDSELFRNWMHQEVRAVETPSVPASPTHVPLNKMGPHDNPEAFLYLFERSAPVRLIPLLSREAQIAAQQLPVQKLLVYDDLRRAILQQGQPYP